MSFPNAKGGRRGPPSKIGFGVLRNLVGPPLEVSSPGGIVVHVHCDTEVVWQSKVAPFVEGCSLVSVQIFDGNDVEYSYDRTVAGHLWQVPTGLAKDFLGAFSQQNSGTFGGAAVDVTEIRASGDGTTGTVFFDLAVTALVGHGSVLIGVGGDIIIWTTGGTSGSHAFVTTSCDAAEPWDCSGGEDDSLSGAILNATSGFVT